MAAALLGVLALVLFVGPFAATARAGAASAATASTARGVAPLGIGHRQTRDQLRAQPRSSARGHSLFAADIERLTIVEQTSTVFAAVLSASMLVAPLAACFLAGRDRTRQVSRRARGTRRDRAPPALALT